MPRIELLNEHVEQLKRIALGLYIVAERIDQNPTVSSDIKAVVFAAKVDAEDLLRVATAALVSS